MAQVIADFPDLILLVVQALRRKGAPALFLFAGSRQTVTLKEGGSHPDEGKRQLLNGRASLANGGVCTGASRTPDWTVAQSEPRIRRIKG